MWREGCGRVISLQCFYNHFWPSFWEVCVEPWRSQPEMKTQVPQQFCLEIQVVRMVTVRFTRAINDLILRWKVGQLPFAIPSVRWLADGHCSMWTKKDVCERVCNKNCDTPNKHRKSINEAGFHLTSSDFIHVNTRCVRNNAIIVAFHLVGASKGHPK
jgi:hypothetical protein